MTHRCCYAGCKNEAASKNSAYCLWHRGALIGERGHGHGHQRQCGTHGCTRPPISRDALFCRECGQERIKSGGGRKFAKVYCKECGKLLNSSNRSGYCSQHYKREWSHTQRTKESKVERLIQAWQRGELEMVWIDGVLSSLNHWKPRDDWKQGGFAPDGTGPGVKW